MRRSHILILLLLTVVYGVVSAASQAPSSTYDNSLVLAPLYVDYAEDSAEEFAREADELKLRIPAAPYVKVGFAAFVTPQFPDIPLDKTVTESDMAGDLAKIDLLVNRAREHGLINHISLVSGFFHGDNPLRRGAIKRDVRNAQWFADGLIADPNQLRNPVPQSAWVTPSRYAQPLRTRIEEGIRILASRLAARMREYPNTLLTVSGDGETEFSFERNFADNGNQPGNRKDIIYTDYSPFMVAEFRDFLRNGRYDGDSTPGSDDDANGHTLNSDFGQGFTTWKLRYFDNSGPISYNQYLQLPEKLPRTGPYATEGGFDAPRAEKPGDTFWEAWIDFRKRVIGNWVRDFATWVTTSADPATGFKIPASRFYTHQIPADRIFGKSNDPRLKTSASYIETTIINPLGSTGVTAFNGFDGKRHAKTATPALFSALFKTSDNWGVVEYNPSVPYRNDIPPSSDERYYASELRMLWNFRPHIIVPVLWSDLPGHKSLSIKGTAYERALKGFVREVGKSPWYSLRTGR